MPIAVSTEVMRASDKWTIENLVPSKELMERAGKAIFEQVDWKGPVGIICGKGNNAGDGFVVASLLKDHGICSSRMRSLRTAGTFTTSVSKKVSGPYLRAITALIKPFLIVSSVPGLRAR